MDRKEILTRRNEIVEIDCKTCKLNCPLITQCYVCFLRVYQVVHYSITETISCDIYDFDTLDELESFVNFQIDYYLSRGFNLK